MDNPAYILYQVIFLTIGRLNMIHTWKIQINIGHFAWLDGVSYIWENKCKSKIKREEARIAQLEFITLLKEIISIC